jgi:hypothetical protein
MCSPRDGGDKPSSQVFGDFSSGVLNTRRSGRLLRQWKRGATARFGHLWAQMRWVGSFVLLLGSLDLALSLARIKSWVKGCFSGFSRSLVLISSFMRCWQWYWRYSPTK